MNTPFSENKSNQSQQVKEPTPVLQGSALAEAHGATFNWPPVIKNAASDSTDNKSKLQHPSFAFDLLQYNAKTYKWI